jgi:phosphoethanolamine N-methyltransferase
VTTQHSRETDTSPAARFSRRSALRSERVYGQGYQGPAGDTLFEGFTAGRRMWPGMRILDIGSGLGGDSMRLAARFGARVTGLDMAPDMTEICQERLLCDPVAGVNVNFVTGDIRTVLLPEAGFDLIWTRDCGMYMPVPDMRPTWSRIHASLAAQGQVLLTDYCRGARVCSSAFEEHVADCRHHLVTIEHYAQILQDAGFARVDVEDRTEDLLQSMVWERTRLAASRESFITDFTEQEYREIAERWDKKIEFAQREELVWLVLTADK